MSRIVLGVGASHTTGMNTRWNEVKDIGSAERFRDGLIEAKKAIAAAAPDAVVIVGSNHFRGFYLDLMPAFTLGVGECIAAGEGGTPSGPQKVDTELARHLCRSLLAEDFDIAFSLRLNVDHGVSHAIQYLLEGMDLPIVPMVVNVFAPPLPSLARCRGLGEALGRAVGSFEGARRVAIIGTGGLSHQLPWPDWQAPQSENDRLMLEGFTDREKGWKEYEVRRRAMQRKSAPVINSAFDHEFLGALEAGRLQSFPAHSSEQLQAVAGNGAQELRAWLITSAALGYVPGKTLAYEAIPEWSTGMAVAVFEPDPAGAHA